jgi:hypothetical protein
MLAVADRQARDLGPDRSPAMSWRIGAIVGIAALLPAASLVVYSAVGSPAALDPRLSDSSPDAKLQSVRDWCVDPAVRRPPWRQVTRVSERRYIPCRARHGGCGLIGSTHRTMFLPRSAWYRSRRDLGARIARSCRRRRWLAPRIASLVTLERPRSFLQARWRRRDTDLANVGTPSSCRPPKRRFRA